MKSHQSRTVRIASMAVAIPLSITACDRKMVDTPDDTTNLAANVMEQPEPVPPPPTLSIMRPSVGDEVKSEPAQPAEPLNEQISFAQGGMALDDASRAQLDALARKSEMIQGGAITVRGHSDSQGSDSDNLRVSEARAKAVADYLVTKGIASDRMTVLGIGETRSIAPNAHPDGSDDEQGRAKNRRVDVEVAPAPAPEQEKTEP